MKSSFTKTLAALAALGVLASACAAPAAPAAPAEPAAPAQPAATDVPADAAATEAPAPTEAPAAPAAGDEFKVGLILVGPSNDKGWNQAHVEGANYITSKMPNVKIDVVDKVNPADRPNVRSSQVADDLIAAGAKVVIFNSDDFKDDALESAQKHPDVTIIHSSGDYAWADGKNFKDQANLGNIMPKMEYGHMINGCAAALQTQTGKIGQLGALINEETRRYASSQYLGAKYCWENFRKKDPKDLTYETKWIGFWFNIPGVTADPTKVADEFFANGYDVVISGIDTPEAANQAAKAAAAGSAVNFVHYGHKAGCDSQPDLCLGVAFYNWGPAYYEAVKSAADGAFKSAWVRPGPDWADLNNADTSGFGYTIGNGTSAENKANLEAFIKGLGDGSIDLLQGPINYQDGSPWLAEGQKATVDDMWYMPQLLEGMTGASK